MEPQKKALGRGLTSLIPSAGRQDAASKSFLEIPLADIVTNPNQPRKLFAKEAIDELAQSIEEKGVIQPLIVRPLGGGKYELVAGERRYRASKQAGLETIPAIIKEVNENETLELALIENIQRENLNVIEEALAYKDLLSRFQYTQEELAKRLGKDRSVVANTLRLLKLPDKIRSMIINNELSMGHARALLAIDDKDLQVQIASDILTNQLSVRETENLIRKFKNHIIEEHTAEKKSEIQKEPENMRSEQVVSLEAKLKSMLKTFVSISGTAEKGRLVISYTSKEDLNKLCDKLLKNSWGE